MNVKGRILHSISRRRDGVLLRSELRRFGSSSQVSTALLDLCNEGAIVRVEHGVYVSPAQLSTVGKEVLLETARQRPATARERRAFAQGRTARRTTTSRYVSLLAKQHGVIFKPTYSDQWAGAVTRLAGDEITPDATDDLLVALTREGKLSPDEMLDLVLDHHRALNSHI
jgi:hypothetical protein